MKAPSLNSQEKYLRVYTQLFNYSTIQKDFYDFTSTKDDLFEKEKCLTCQKIGNRGNKKYTHFSAKNL